MPVLHAAFGECDISPAAGTQKIGWLRVLHGERLLDPLMARLALFRKDGAMAAFLQLDLLSVRWTVTRRIRQAVTARFGFDGTAIMVAATHNHAGPAVANCGDVPADSVYTDILVQRCVDLFGATLQRLQPAETGFGHTHVWDVAHNRRVVMRDGTVRTHGTFNDPDALYIEGPIDPELAVLAVRSRGGGPLLGCLVNFACHPTAHGGDDVFSAGYPGCLAADLKQRGVPIPLFLNGACGNLHTSDPVQGGRGLTMQAAGSRLAEAAWTVIGNMTFDGNPTPCARSQTVALPYRQASADEQKGTLAGAQRFIDSAIYDRHMPALMDRIRDRGSQPAEIQILRFDNVVFAAIPAEYFVEHQLRIKTEAWPLHALVVSHANGMIGYVPTRAAFDRGGYETTFAPSSRMAPEAGDRLARAALDLIRSHEPA